MELTLREAALRTGVHKTSLGRAIRSGRLSARRTEGGGYVVDPAELFRVFPPVPGDASDALEQERSAPRSVLQNAPPEEVMALHLRCGAAEARAEALQGLLAVERQRVEEWKAVADRWAQQAERLALAPPVMPKRRWWWRQRAG